jgi:nicotinic acid phosphoribosyltransferase
MESLIPSLICDFYKTSHHNQYPKDTEFLYSTLVPRSNKYLPTVDRVVSVNITGFLKKYFVDYFNKFFFERPEEEVVQEYCEFIKRTLRINDNGKHIRKLHKLAYLPIRVKAIPEGRSVPIGVPNLTIENTHKEFAWLTNYLETLLSCSLWSPITSASIARQYRIIGEKYAAKTCDNNGHVSFQFHDFSMRGMSSLESAQISGLGHLIYFDGTDNIPAITYTDKYYSGKTAKDWNPTSIPACYDSETEVLTDTGWKKFQNLQETDKVAQYHKSGEIDFVKPTEYYNIPYKGKMIKYGWNSDLNYIDIFVTPNHKMVKKNKEGIIELFEASKNMYSVEGSKAIISGTKIKGDITSLSPLDKFLIAFQADGSFFNKKEYESQYTGGRSGTFPVRFTLKKIRKIERLTNILNDLGWAFNKSFSKSRKGYVYFYIKVPFLIKHKISKYFKDWVNLSEITSSWGCDFINELQYWDGKATGKDGIGYFTIVEENADFVQAISHISGLKSKITKDNPDKIRGNRKIGYDSNIIFRTDIGGKGITFEEIDYDGTVHCVSVPTKILVVRRNKAVAICGNTEHSVMCANIAKQQAEGKGRDETETYRKLITETYPSGYVSIVSDTYDFWHNVSVVIPSLKDEIMARDGRVVIRPDSGNPVEIICGTVKSDGVTPEEKGLIEVLWETFGGTVNEKGYKILDPHIGAIYGDSITLERAELILAGLEAKGFASSNIVFGIGSFSYAGPTRDSLGFAVKATSVTQSGIEYPIQKDPKTDPSKKSFCGRIKIVNDKCIDNMSSIGDYSDDELEVVFENGIVSHVDIGTIRKRALSEI